MFLLLRAVVFCFLVYGLIFEVNRRLVSYYDFGLDAGKIVKPEEDFEV